MSAQSGEEMQNGLEQIANKMDGQLVPCRIDELRPHPCYIRNQLAPSAQQISALTTLGVSAFREPIVVTRDRIIIDGYARWELARLQDFPTLLCLEYELTETEALEALVQTHRRSNGLNDFCRILLAQELEPWFKNKARLNQQIGGHKKGSSKLTEAETVDVRAEIAAVAGVSVGNVSKVKQLIRTAQPELVTALRHGEIRIHRAWLWSNQSPQKQRDSLWIYQSKKAVRKISKRLALRHRRDRDDSSPITDDLENLLAFLSELQPSERNEINVVTVKAPGKTIFLTEELVKSFRPYQEAIPICATNSH